VEIKVVSKGYTIKVVSWENDGDSQWEKSLTVETKEEAEFYNRLINFAAEFGNEIDLDEGQIQSIMDFINFNINWFDINPGYDEDDYLVAFRRKCYDLMGYPVYEDYQMRVLDSIRTIYSPEDIHATEIIFNNTQ